MKRRNFIKVSGVAGLSALSTASFSKVQIEQNLKKENLVEFKKGFKILFQGDSITDGNRTRDNDWNHIMGHGYAYLIASKLWFENPDKEFMFYNRGISGNRVKDLDQRWETDTIALAPDVISILIGVNDVLAHVKGWEPDPFDKYEEYFKSVLDKTKISLPDAKIIICEPFILDFGWVMEKNELWHQELEKRQVLARKLANDYSAIFVELQEPFNKACSVAKKEYWIWDGVHPMPAGHELIAREWLKNIRVE